MAKEVLNGAQLKKVLEALEGNWQAEMEGYHTYLALADRDTDPVRAHVLRHLAAAEEEHAALWASRIKDLGGPEPVYTGRPHGEADSLANRAGGVRMALRRLEIEESRHIANYGTQLEGSRRRGFDRDSQSRHRRRKGAPPRAGFAAARALSCPGRDAQGRSQGRAR